MVGFAHRVLESHWGGFAMPNDLSIWFIGPDRGLKRVNQMTEIATTLVTFGKYMIVRNTFLPKTLSLRMNAITMAKKMVTGTVSKN